MAQDSWWSRCLIFLMEPFKGLNLCMCYSNSTDIRKLEYRIVHVCVCQKCVCLLHKMNLNRTKISLNWHSDQEIHLRFVAIIIIIEFPFFDLFLEKFDPRTVSLSLCPTIRMQGGVLLSHYKKCIHGHSKSKIDCGEIR